MHDALRALDAWFHDATLEPVPGGLINRTYGVRRGDRAVAVLQALNTAIFSPEVHRDIEAITSHLAAKGVETPRLLRTRAGTLWHTDPDGGIWRMLTHLGETTRHRLTNPAQARSAGALIGRFHAALADYSGTFASTRPFAHDTPRHLAFLRASQATHTEHRLAAPVARVAAEIEEMWASWESHPEALSRRVVHGDLKVSNLRFEGDEAICLVDLDTMAYGTIDAELGDALRSWCNPSSEDDPNPTFDLTIFAAAMEGYARTGSLSEAEWDSIVPGTERICLELSGRFLADALNERYFGFDPKLGTRGDHNLLRARGQLALARSVRAQRDRAGRTISAVRTARA